MRIENRTGDSAAVRVHIYVCIALVECLHVRMYVYIYTCVIQVRIAVCVKCSGFKLTAFPCSVCGA